VVFSVPAGRGCCLARTYRSSFIHFFPPLIYNFRLLATVLSLSRNLRQTALSESVFRGNGV